MKKELYEALVSYQRDSGISQQKFVKEIFEIALPKEFNSLKEEEKPTLFKKIDEDKFLESFKKWSSPTSPTGFNAGNERAIIAARYLLLNKQPDIFSKHNETLNWYSFEWVKIWFQNNHESDIKIPEMPPIQLSDESQNILLPEDNIAKNSEATFHKKYKWLFFCLAISALVSVYYFFRPNTIAITPFGSGSLYGALDMLQIKGFGLNKLEREGTFTVLQELKNNRPDQRNNEVWLTSKRLEASDFEKSGYAFSGKCYLMEIFIAEDASLFLIKNNLVKDSIIYKSELLKLMCKNPEANDPMEFISIYERGGIRSATMEIIKSKLILPDSCNSKPNMINNTATDGINGIDKLLAESLKPSIAFARTFLVDKRYGLSTLPIIDDLNKETIHFPKTGLFIYILSDDEWHMESDIQQYVLQILDENTQKKLEISGLSVFNNYAEEQRKYLKEGTLPKNRIENFSVNNSVFHILRSPYH